MITALKPVTNPALSGMPLPPVKRFAASPTDEVDKAVFQGSRLITLPNGSQALDTNGLSYQQYINVIMPQLKLTPAQQWGTWMIRRLYQGTTRNTVYKWFGNPCLYKKKGNLSCSEYTLMMLQTCGMRRGVIQGWHRISNEGPNPLTHPKMFLATLPFIGKRFRDQVISTQPAKDKPIPLTWFKDPSIARQLAAL